MNYINNDDVDETDSENDADEEDESWADEEVDDEESEEDEDDEGGADSEASSVGAKEDDEQELGHVMFDTEDMSSQPSFSSMRGNNANIEQDEYEYDTSDEEDIRNTTGNVPKKWLVFIDYFNTFMSF